MLYNAIPQAHQVTIDDALGAPMNFPSTPATAAMRYALAWGQADAMQNGHAGHIVVPANSAAHIMNLISCAGVAYVYTDGGGAVLNVTLYHSHTGLIPAGDLPHHVTPHYNVNAVPAAQIHVVFASSQSMHPLLGSSIQSAGQGLVDIVNVSQVPLANIRVITGTGTRWGVNGAGDVGSIPAPRHWANGNLTVALTGATALAIGDYAAQFPPGHTTMGFMGSGHNLTTGNARIANLNVAINGAPDDGGRITAVRAFFLGAGSYKAGSLKLLLARRLDAAFRGGFAVPHGVGITTANAAAQVTNILNGITAGIY